VIVGIDDTPVNHYDDLYNAVDSHKAGDHVALKVRRGNGVVAVKVDVTEL
jgi:S1-C subfamily serine protease